MSVHQPEGVDGSSSLESGDQPQYSCRICSKLFAKRLSRNRHVLYCQKQARGNHSRKKSCTLCRRAKTKCSETLPRCVRCSAKGLECMYEDDHRSATPSKLVGLNESEFVPEGAAAASGTLVAGSSAQISHMKSVDSNHEASSQVNSQLNTALSLQDYLPDFVQLDDDHDNSFDWSCQLPQVDLQNGYIDPDHTKFTPQVDLFNLLESSNESTGYSMDALNFQSSSVLPHQSSSLSGEDTLSSLISAREARVGLTSSTAQKIGLFRRRERSFGSQLRCYYLLQTLRSYPRAMLSGTVPPFIHLNSGVLDGGNPDNSSMSSSELILQEPLAICKSIVLMYFSKTLQSTSFVWRTIETELDRLGISFGFFDDWALMSALQAVTIYILLATLEEDNLSPGIDARMLHIMMAIAAKIQHPSYTNSIARYGVWQEWILKESRDRTFTLLFIINTLFDINPTHDPDACNELLSMPVPAYKSLWDASSFTIWNKAHTDFVQKRGGRPNLTYRDMVEVHMRTQTNQVQTLGDLDDWFLNLDSFGNFVLMTATSI